MTVIKILLILAVIGLMVFVLRSHGTTRGGVRQDRLGHLHGLRRVRGGGSPGAVKANGDGCRAAGSGDDRRTPAITHTAGRVAPGSMPLSTTTLSQLLTNDGLTDVPLMAVKCRSTWYWSS